MTDFFDNWTVQVRKGLLEMCILTALEDRERYGYDLVKGLVGVPGLGITEGTVYPLLSRLRRHGLIASRLEESSGGPARKYPFAFCSQVGCLARLGFADADVTNFKRGNVAELTIVPAFAPERKVELGVSLSGFTAGFARLQELSAQ